ncbi:MULTISPECIES: hypothetical protein [unclassified Chryseobacterium]|uniref:hypothetical protein n=1 Tax=unclassified Chryseobacterium TaxID=2593645 RepID=UPI00226A1DD8|nr:MULTISPECIES: hypothetical protein [unclassified Chryseobacterium]
MRILKIISVLSYCCILIMGMMIAVPMILFLIGTAIDFGNIDQVFAILGIVGIVLTFISWKEGVSKSIIAFLFMISPIISRLFQAPVESFNYLVFTAPLAIFIITYLIVIILQIKEKLNT